MIKNKKIAGLTIKREEIATVEIRRPSVFDLTFTGELWASKTLIFKYNNNVSVLIILYWHLTTLIGHNNYYYLLALFFSFFSSLSLLDGTPYDGAPIPQIQSIHVAVTVVFVTLSTAGIVFAIACMIFNFIFRERKYVLNG